MNEPVFENSMFTDDKSYEISELQYTENEFILNKFLSCCDGCFYI